MLFSTSGCSSMLGTSRSSVAGIDFLHEPQLVAEAHHLDGQVIVDEGKFLAERRQILLLAQQAAQDLRKLVDHLARLLGIWRISEATEFSVLNRKCGLIWRLSAARRASFRRNCCCSSFFSLRVAVPDLDRQHGAKQGGRIDRHGPASRLGSAQVFCSAKTPFGERCAPAFRAAIPRAGSISTQTRLKAGRRRSRARSRRHTARSGNGENLQMASLSGAMSRSKPPSTPTAANSEHGISS